MPTVQSKFRILCPTGTGDLEIPVDLGGRLPTGIEIIGGHQTNIGINNDQNKGCRGFADASLNMYCDSWQDQDGQGTTNSDQRHSNTHCLEILNTGAQTVDISARVLSGAFDTADQVTLNFDNVGAAVYIEGTIYANINTVVGHIDIDGEAQDDPITKSGLVITPRLIKFSGQSGSNGFDVSTAQVTHSMGMGCLYDGNYPQGAQSTALRNGQGTSENSSRMEYFNDSGNALSRCYIAQTGLGAYHHSLELTSVSSGQFIVTLRDGAPGDHNRIGFMAFETDVDEVNLLGPNFSSTGENAFTGMGFKSSHIHFEGGLVQSLTAARQSDPGAGTENMNYWDGVPSGDGPRGMNWWSADGVGTSNTKNANQWDRVLNVKTGGATIGLRSDENGPQSFEADGFILEIDTLLNSVYQLALGFKSYKNPWSYYDQQQ